MNKTILNMINRIIYFSILVLILSCDKKKTEINSDKDVEKARELATNFYKDLSENDTLKIFGYLDKNITSLDFGNFFRKNLKDNGTIQRVDIKKTKTTNVNFNDNIEINYVLEIYVEYEKSKNIEVVTFIKRNEDPIKLDGYQTEEIIE